MGTVAAEAVRIDYPKYWFVLGTAFGAVVTAVMLYLASGSVEAFTRIFWTACAVLIGGSLLLLFLPPVVTCHHAGEKALRLRMGLLMNATLPYRYVKAVGDTAVRFGPVTVGIGVVFVSKKRTVFVTSSFKDLVSITLLGPQELGGPLRPLVDKVVMSVKDKEAFVSLLRERAGLEEA